MNRVKETLKALDEIEHIVKNKEIGIDVACLITVAGMAEEIAKSLAVIADNCEKGGVE